MTTLEAQHEVITDLILENKKLKQERDEAKRIYDIEATEHMLNINEICNQRDAAMDALRDISFYPSSGIGDDNTTVQEYKDRILDGIKHLKQERDEARKELEEYRSIAENIGAVKAVSEKEKAICERNESLEKLKPLRQSICDSQDEVLRLTFENREISQELDRARDTIMKIEEIFIDSEDMHDDWIKVGNIARTFCEKYI